jgi:hypothetical protein
MGRNLGGPPHHAKQVRVQCLSQLSPDMEILAERVGGGAMFELPMTSTRIKQLK